MERKWPMGLRNLDGVLRTWADTRSHQEKSTSSGDSREYLQLANNRKRRIGGWEINKGDYNSTGEK